MEKKINVVITDDHKLFRKGIAALLSDFEFVNNIYEAGNGIELLNLLQTLDSKPDIILLDLGMPEMDGAEAQKLVRSLYPEIKIIILTMEDDEHMIIHLIEEGINGYLLKNADPEEMELAIRKVVQQGFYFSTDITELIIRGFKQKKNKHINITEELTKKELLVLELICKQNTAVEIAIKMTLSARTIEGYRRKLMDKTGTKNMAGLVVFAIKNKLVNV